ncbi:50S ribosomal protein L29 [Candidatus Nomurabacteria bacterium CG_4_9_14_0_2_um_filter_32_10]|uniref:Large ribosomal subunit protein uL29 n=2 Tax=Candidatus Nomuraibacteriota TaxID=1752729 RepID=A0A2J0MDZ2_9BACT|nr:MAG: 50S ribosomal protein L29 [Candidatus Nomurabacteria bacterium CG_4_10_14_0_2_um_filter_33_9]PJC49377.1 MAG: 50S ribosomal protein L29 [Candidatus Nomurabacteria bacterium CG_4_9_14_0_2_um_filter_32_10]
MAKKKENLKGMKIDELKLKLSDLEKDIRVLRFKAQGARSKNVKESVTLRKQVARVLTEINKSSRKF